MIMSSSNRRSRAKKYRSHLRSLTIVTAFFCCSAVGITHLWAGEKQPALSPIPSSQIFTLDGKTFSGELGLLGEPASSTDLLAFNDGMFISKECERKCGYTEGIYWVRPIDDGIEVLSETPCLEADATIVWRGVVKGDKIEGTFTWTSKRWYWTIEKEFWFNGKLVETDTTVTE